MTSTFADTLSRTMVTMTRDVTVEYPGPALHSYIPMMKEEGYKFFATTLHVSELSSEHRHAGVITSFAAPNVPGNEDAFVFVRTGKATPKEYVRLPDITVLDKRLKSDWMSSTLIYHALHSELTWGKELGAQVSVKQKRHRKMFKSYVTFTDITIHGTPASIARIKSRLADALAQVQ